MIQSESLARIQRQNFPLPTTEEVKQIYVQRVKAFRSGETDSKIFADQALDYLIDYSKRIPRVFIQNCSLILNAMQNKGISEACDLNFVLGSLGIGTILKETDAINILLPWLKAENRVWVKVKEFKEILVSKYGVTIDEKRLGRRLKNDWNLEHRMNPDSEYKVVS
jgi:hypothetical protein